MIHWGVPSAKVGLSAKFCVPVFKACLLYYLESGWSICQSMFVCQVLCTSIQGIYSLIHCGVGRSICQSRFICQVLCTSIQGISALITQGGQSAQSRFVCQVLCTSIQGISALLTGGPSAKVCSYAKFCVVYSNIYSQFTVGVHLPK